MTLGNFVFGVIEMHPMKRQAIINRHLVALKGDIARGIQIRKYLKVNHQKRVFIDLNNRINLRYSLKRQIEHAELHFKYSRKRK